MRRLFLAVLGVVAVTGVASAQQPIYQQPPIAPPAYSPGAVAATPVQPASGATVIRGNGGCSNCGPTVASSSRGFTMSKVSGGGCATGDRCNSGCGSVKSDLAFHFGSCKSFFSPCGPSLGGHGGGFFGGGKCPTTQFAQPWGQGFGCPRAYDSYANH